MNDNRNTIVFSHSVNVLGTRDGAQDGSLLTFQLQALTSDESSTAVRELNNNRRLGLGGSFQNSVDGVSTNYVYCWQCELVRLGNFKYFLYVVASDHARFNKIEDLRHFYGPIECSVPVERTLRSCKEVFFITQKTGGVSSRLPA